VRTACTWLTLAAAALCACGRLDFDVASPRTGDAVLADAPLAAFGNVTHLSELGSPSEDIVPSLQGDQLQVMFASQRPDLGAFILWQATRASTAEPFSNLATVQLPSTNSSSEPSLSVDGLTLIFVRNSSDLAVTTRGSTSANAPWGVPQTIAELVGFTGADFVGDLRLVMSTSEGSLYESTRPDTSTAWSVPAQLTELDRPNVALGFPTASIDGLEIIFEATPAGGVTQLAHARRPSVDAAFGAIAPIDVGFPTVRVGDPELSLDGHTLLFVAENGTQGDFEIYQATR